VIRVSLESQSPPVIDQFARKVPEGRAWRPQGVGPGVVFPFAHHLAREGGEVSDHGVVRSGSELIRILRSLLRARAPLAYATEPATAVSYPRWRQS
jgi:hypothetical protein